jgi:hypothetical protein
MNNLDGRFGEIINQSAVVVQCAQDEMDVISRGNASRDHNIIYDPTGRGAPTDTPSMRIDINDLVFTVGATRMVSGGGGLNESAIPVSSNTAGLYVSKMKAPKYVDTQNVTQEDAILAVSDNLRFIGQALGATNPRPDHPKDKKLNFTTRVQGTGHIINTGGKDISPGETVYWDLFTEDEVRSEEFKKRLKRFGYGEYKVPLKLITIKGVDRNYKNAILRSINDKVRPSKGGGGSRKNSLLGVFGDDVTEFILKLIPLIGGNNGKKSPEDILKILTTQPGFDAAIHHLVRSMITLQSDLKRREVGKALSFSKPGTGLDILLGAN